MVGHQDVPVVGPPGTSPLAPGTVFAGHFVEALVGRGGMGVVYRARHCVLDRVVALKLIAPELVVDESFHRRFAQEVATAASIEHPNVVPVHDAGETDGVAYMVMRYVDGADLHTTVRGTGRLAPVRAAAIVAKVGDALDTLHRAGFVHRDVKPRNVLIARGGHVYLCDFGLARQARGRSHATGADDCVGTADYVAPEQICGGPTDARTDVYGLGGLLYFALTGRRPYERDDDGEKLWAHLYEMPPSPSRLCPELPRPMDVVVRRALAKDPADRFESAGELGRAALRAARGTRPLDPPRTAARPTPSRRHRVSDRGFTEAPTVSSAGSASLQPMRRAAAPRTRMAAPANVLAGIADAVLAGVRS